MPSLSYVLFAIIPIFPFSVLLVDRFLGFLLTSRSGLFQGLAALFNQLSCRSYFFSPSSLLIRRTGESLFLPSRLWSVYLPWGFGGVDFDGELDGSAFRGELGSVVFDGGLGMSAFSGELDSVTFDGERGENGFLGGGPSFISTYCSSRRVAQWSSNVFSNRSAI